MRSRDDSQDQFLQLIPTEGDFPHARRRGVRLACCTCTCCCFTLLLGGIGSVVGLASGILHGARVPNPAPEQAIGILWRLLFIIGFAVAFCVLGALVGAAIGFAVDFVVFQGRM